MPLSAKAIRKQLNMLKPLLSSCSLKTIRKAQDKIGELTESRYREQVLTKEHAFENFRGIWIVPRDQRREGVILYLHGGGYTCGGTEYAAGFGSMLAAQTGTRVFGAAYRLAPEHRFPAALDDAVEAYRYLLDKGYPASHITVCGESAGGGLCYALCLRLKAAGLPLPCGIITISPWTDLTASGDSYIDNRAADPSLSAELLNFFADSYTADRTDPLVSPLFADLSELPPSLIFVGGDEILLDDARELHRRLLEAGCQSRLLVAPERWHGYLLYGLAEDRKDLRVIDQFLNQEMAQENKLRWLPLDNAAKIYPAARRQNWSNVFRLSATLTEDIDVDVLRTALDITIRRFPSIAVRLRRGVFWYYLQQVSEVPEIRQENSFPLTRMSRDETRRCAFRVIVYGRRLAVEFFHSLTDGNGALVFLKSLTAEYLQQKYGVHIPAECGVLGRLEEPTEEELEDSFQQHAGTINASRKENTAWRLTGTPEPTDHLHVTCLRLSVQEVLAKAHEYGVSLTTFLCAAMMQAMQQIQKERIPSQKRRKPIKVLLPVNLRPLFHSKTMRNFAMYTTPEILPQLGEYTFEEICQVIKSHMGAEITPKQMSMKIATNVNSERIMAVRVMPLFVKNIVMKAIFDSVGERKSCLTLSNLGAVKLPKEMQPFVERLDFILGVQATAPYNCGVLSYGDSLYINFIRNIRESELEYRFYCVLREMGLSAEVQSNHPNQKGE
ncbi:MAG: alpha/beta hydrolase fold domain-containing protein [Clostridia bacterium]|nr:alpha/beta hydrolase fold domain-containing protein [Clostridia bacterium]